jgi:hypothetical protein
MFFRSIKLTDDHPSRKLLISNLPDAALAPALQNACGVAQLLIQGPNGSTMVCPQVHPLSTAFKYPGILIQ